MTYRQATINLLLALGQVFPHIIAQRYLTVGYMKAFLVVLFVHYFRPCHLHCIILINWKANLTCLFITSISKLQEPEVWVTVAGN